MNRRRTTSGFTFLEIILVVSIIVILAGIVGPLLVGRKQEADISATRAQMSSIETSLGMFEVSVGRFPTTSEGIEALVTRPSSIDERDWKQTMSKVPTDAWGERFKYVYPSTHGLDYDLFSKGPDRTEGTEDDITNWEDASDEGA